MQCGDSTCDDNDYNGVDKAIITLSGLYTAPSSLAITRTAITGKTITAKETFTAGNQDLSQVYFDLYDENKILTGETIYKGQEVPKGRYYITVVVFIQNDKNDVNIVLEKENVILMSEKTIDLTDIELNEFLCSYKKLVDDKKLKINICENTKKYDY